MRGKNKAPRLPMCLLAIVAVGGIAGTAAAAAGNWRSKVSAKLLSVYDSPAAARSASAELRKSAGADTASLDPRFNAKGWVQADVHYDCSREAPTQALSSAGLSIGSSVKLGSLCVVEGWIAPEALLELASIDGVTRVQVPAYAVHPRRRIQPVVRPAASSGASIDRNGVTIMHADQFVTQTGTSGAGVKVGVQSGGVSSVQMIQSRGELPAVQLVNPSDGATSPTGDEGTVLLEEVHAVAPGAALAYCGPSTFVEYTSCLSQLIAAGVNILVDDLIFPEQDLLSSDSSAVQAIEQLLTQNPSVVLFTAGGNYNGSYWEGNYAPVSLSSLGLTPLTCTYAGTTQTDYYVSQFDGDPHELLTVTQSSRIPVAFAWADPGGHNASKFDVYWINTADSTQTGCIGIATTSGTQLTTNVSIPAGSYTLYIATPDATPSGKFLKLWIGGDGLTTLSKSTAGSVVTPQAFAAGSVMVGAVNGADGLGKTIETFSSLGPITLLFPGMTRIQSPVVVAPDGINVDAAGTYFEGNLFPDGNFYGTSASAPNAAAVGALLRGAFPFLTASQLVSALKTGAVQLGTTVPDGTFGYGRIDAMGALATFATPTITSLPDSAITAGSSSPSYSFTVTGTGPLHFTITSSNPSSIPAAVVAAGSPGVTITPAACGTSTLTCSLSVMAANGPGDTVTVTVAAVDGANRSATASMKVNVTGNQSAPTNSTPQPSAGSGGGGGTLDWWVIAALLIVTGARVASKGALTSARAFASVRAFASRARGCR